jgi:hypothetical protein
MNEPLCVCVCVIESERASYKLLKIETTLDMKEITHHHFRRWGQRNETWIDSNCAISCCFDPFHVPSWFLFSRPIVLSIHMPAFHNFSMFLMHLLVFEHLLEVWAGACIHADYRGASLADPKPSINRALDVWSTARANGVDKSAFSRLSSISPVLVCVCVCVCEREREREIDRELHTAWTSFEHFARAKCWRVSAETWDDRGQRIETAFPQGWPSTASHRFGEAVEKKIFFHRWKKNFDANATPKVVPLACVLCREYEWTILRMCVCVCACVCLCVW